MARVLIGIPEGIKDKIFWVAREYRTNQLSFVPGGSDVIVVYHNSSILGYDWVKLPSRYIPKIMDKEIEVIYVGYGEMDENQQLHVFKTMVSSIYARKYSPDNWNSAPFEKIWDSTTSKELPWEVLKDFDMEI